jgi:hypothetical protein
MSLILHCGAHAITRQEIERLPEPVSQGPRHAPMHHAVFLGAVHDALDRSNFEVTEEAYGATRDGTRLFGVVSVKHAGLRGLDGGGWVVGVRASHDRSLAQAISSGSHVFVCDNLAFSGDVVMKTKQTTFVGARLPHLLADMVGDLMGRFEHQVDQLDAYRTTSISRDVADSAILEMGRRGVINWSELGKVVSEWDCPSHDEHAEDGDTVWRLFNAATEALKPRNPDHPRLPFLAEKTLKLHRICDRVAGVPLAA